MNTTHTKIIKRDNGTQYQINVRLTYPNHDVIEYDFSIFYRDKGGRKWHNLPNTLHDFEIRAMPLAERASHYKTNYLRFVSKAEINNTIDEFWQQLKPNIEYDKCNCKGCSVNDFKPDKPMYDLGDNKKY